MAAAAQLDPRADPAPRAARAYERAGMAMVLGSALVWSVGGAIARFIDIADPWTVVFWRSTWAAAFLLLFLVWRDGLRGAARLFLGMGGPGLLVALCFATASTSFIVALQHTTVANIVLIQAGVPLFAALIGRLVFGERIDLASWIAIAAVFAGVGVMVSGSFSGRVSPIGDALALLIAVAFACATVVTRRHPEVRMTPACCLGTLLAAAVAASLAGSLVVGARDMGFLFLFGAANLGLGMALFATGARRIAAPAAALIGVSEPVAAPIWVWAVHGETPAQATLAGGAIVLAALVGHILWRMRGRA